MVIELLRHALPSNIGALDGARSRHGYAPSFVVSSNKSSDYVTLGKTRWHACEPSVVVRSN